MLFSVMLGDITACTTDAIVNAANNSLSDGVGVNGAIHRAAGSELPAYCQKLGGCATGAAVITPGFNLPAKYIIHTVGPVWHGGDHNEADLLASCYKSCLAIAQTHADIKSIAFPAISTGVFGYPLELAAAIAVQTVQANAQESALPQVIFVCFDAAAAHVYTQLLNL